MITRMSHIVKDEPTLVFSVSILGTVVLLLVATMLSSANVKLFAQPTIDQSISQSFPSGDIERVIQSNENSENARVTQEIDRDHDVRQAGAADKPALKLERSIETPNKNIEIDVESADQSKAAQSSNEAEVEVEGGDPGDIEQPGGDGGEDEIPFPPTVTPPPVIDTCRSSSCGEGDGGDSEENEVED
jgi:hypothetical protein